MAACTRWQTCLSAQLNLALAHSHLPSPSLSPQNPDAPDPYIRIITWNCGGLNSVRFTETLAWLASIRSHTPVDIVCLQETKWRDSAEFSSDDWNCVHSGSGESQAGILFLVHKSLAPQSQLRFNHLCPGRLLHLRIETQPAIDLLGTYQHAWNPQAQLPHASLEQRTQILLQKRAHIHSQISAWVRSVPKRNSLMLLGDFNSSLAPSSPHVGPGVLQHSQPRPDHHDFQQLIVSSGLNALNTWGRSGEPAGTFVMHSGSAVPNRLSLQPLAVPAATAHCRLHARCPSCAPYRS